MIVGAVISPDGCYRYLLWRVWGDQGRICCFVMLNPSTADASIDDRTIRKCIKFAKKWGFDGIVVVNLFAYRATKPKELKIAVDPVGPENDKYLRLVIESPSVEMIVCAWGENGSLNDRSSVVKKLIVNRSSWALRVSLKTGQPHHPLYIPDDTTPFKI
jgi:hypothetical protein